MVEIWIYYLTVSQCYAMGAVLRLKIKVKLLIQLVYVVLTVYIVKILN